MEPSQLFSPLDFSPTPHIWVFKSITIFPWCKVSRWIWPMASRSQVLASLKGCSGHWKSHKISFFHPRLNALYHFPSPAVEICSDGSDFVIPRCDFVYNNAPTIQNVNCTRWLQPEANNTNGSYCYLFSVSDEILFGTNDTNLITIDFYFKILNLTAAIADTISIPSVSISVFDK